MQSPAGPGADGTEQEPQLGLFADPPPASPRATAKPDPETEKIRKTRRGFAKSSSLPAWARKAVAGLPASSIVPDPPLRAAEANLPEAEPALKQVLRHIWSVAALVGEVRTHIEQTWGDLWVHGEISNLRLAPSGHLYFTLKDGEAQLPAVLFRRQAQMLRFRPEDGLEVLLRGKVSVYEQRGQMQLIAEHLEPVGTGSLQIAFEQLKARLAAEGLFETSRKRALPAYPRCVGIVTSPAGAVIRDFLNVAGRRHAALDVLIYPALVQGASAAAEVAAGIAYFNRSQSVEVIVIARGGGSPEDLAPFNTEVLARAIAGSALPVVSAIGHETDFTIADFVADLRAPTPSAAAELITAAQHRVEEQVAALGARLERACRYHLMLVRQRLGSLPVEAMQARLTESLNRREQRVDTLRFRMEAAVRARLHAAATRLAGSSVTASEVRLAGGLAERRRSVHALQQRLAAAQRHEAARRSEQVAHATGRLLQQDASHRLRLLRGAWAAVDARLRRVAGEQLRGPRHRQQRIAERLQGLSPLAVLDRGYALVFKAQGTLVKRSAEVTTGEVLRVRLSQGVVLSRVEQVDPSGEKISTTGEA